MVLALLCLCAGCEASAQGTVFAMDTVMDLQVWGLQADRAVTSLEELLYLQEAIWSSTDPTSMVNQATEPLPLMTQAQELSRRTEGAFDPHLGAVMECWGFYDKQYRVPTQAELEEAMAQKKWDLGGIAKGAAGTLCAQSLQLLNVDRAILNLGGNIQTYGEKPDGSPWTIGIQNPDGGDYLGTVSVTGTMAVVTSGDYQRYFEENGIRYHHIIDPQTGMPARSGLRSVTVICADGAMADALSTALFVMGPEKAAEHWRAYGDFEAVFILDDGRILATQGASFSGAEHEVIRYEN
jgi:thiamine biosynthesis lipoprotein